MLRLPYCLFVSSQSLWGKPDDVSWGYSSRSMERSTWWRILLPAAVWASHPGRRPSSPSHTFRWLQLLLTPWVKPHETLSQNHLAKLLSNSDPQILCAKNVYCFKLLCLEALCFSSADKSCKFVLWSSGLNKNLKSKAIFNSPHHKQV